MIYRIFSSFNKSQPPHTKIAHVHTRARHITMTSFIVEAMVPGIHELIRGYNFSFLSTKTSKIKNLEKWSASLSVQKLV